MANPEHLAKLKEGVEAWNDWREKKFSIKPNLVGANFVAADLRNANLQDANLRDADLYNANLRKADLNRVNLKEAELIRTNLRDANLTDANLIRVQALATNFQGVTLTGACIEDWNINSQSNLQNVKCDYIYLKAIYFEDGKNCIYCDRVPQDPDKIFAPGEFTKRYQKILETVNLYFGEGIDWQVFLNSFQKLQEEEKIKIADGEKEIPIVQGIENTGDGSFIIKIGVSPDTDKGEIEKSFWQKYQPMLEAKEEQINFFREELTIKRQENAQLMSIIKTLAAQDKTNYEIQGNLYQTSGNVGTVHNEGNISDNSQVSGINNEPTQQDSTDN